MGNITVKTNINGMAINFEADVIHLSNCLPEACLTQIIFSVDFKIEEKGGGNGLGSLSISQCNNRVKRYWEMVKWKNLSAEERQQSLMTKKVGILGAIKEIGARPQQTKLKRIVILSNYKPAYILSKTASRNFLTHPLTLVRILLTPTIQSRLEGVSDRSARVNKNKYQIQLSRSEIRKLKV